ncbi:hypothetical protein [Idiomarina abyssalis]|uniref:Uncharacterized protein n=1 Tax=Idiomarina abyssalis TaxID=86102 RepID=A0A8I1GAV0_9GAMM|nr:hypothetical protein [Idiomarina abyssalis]MBJ7265501.1 hypothetical protein [Idiomarina abyssalis]MBJ7316825.1 hypothetical protein [Idiomarina abyssalis]
MKNHLIHLFETKAHIVGHSPLLNGPADTDGRDNGVVHVSWHDVEFDNNEVVEFTPDALEKAERVDDSYFIESIDGETVQVNFYDTVPVT